ncbi:MAG: branched-chain amino acid ABC transporter permease [Rhodobacter sp.]|nr:branched-chain amino acid ABC transporter permease [Paracoccaceae bacterium]MCC0078153.1 branched-chain amino acid ABC transporter permease [Rhodobacter sp.]
MTATPRKLFLAFIVVLLAIGAVLPGYVSPYHTRVVMGFFMFAGLASAWNILGGFSGYWSFGHAAFFGMGAFGAAKISTALGAAAGSPAAMILPVAGATLIVAVFAALIAYPILRLRGIFFAIAMLGVSQVVTELVNNVSWIGGGVGVFMPSPVPAGTRPEVFYYYIFGALLLLIILVTYAIRRSKIGYGLLAIREDEDTAKMLGVPTEHYKIASFVLSGVLVGILGAVYGYSLGYMSTGSVLRLDIGLNMIVFCIIGGIGTIWGPVLGTAIMLFITQVLLSGFLDIHLMITGGIVVLMILLMPSGVLGFFNAKRWIRFRERAR